MKNKKLYWFIAIIIITMSTFLFIQYLNRPKIENVLNNALRDSLVSIQEEADIQNETTKDAINSAINKVLNGSNNDEIVNDENQLTDETKNVIVIEVLSSNSIKLKDKGIEKIVRLIGVSSGGNKKDLEMLINNVTDLHIEQDVKKTDKGKDLVYLWNGEPSEDVNKMINIQMIKNNFASCTYNAGSGVIEQPNIKYFGDFIEATK